MYTFTYYASKMFTIAYYAYMVYNMFITSKMC